jgi:pyruvate dehydrogenase complex dehydrogenase (E1) component
MVRPQPISLPGTGPYEELLSGTGDQVAASTTGALTRLLCNLLRDPGIGTRIVPDRPFVPGPFVPLGTDGFGLSDTRAALRRHFEFDTAHIVVTTLWDLFDQGKIKAKTVSEAARSCGIDADAPIPARREIR